MIAAAKNTQVLLKKNGNTQDIINAILDAEDEVRHQTASFSNNFERSRRGMYELWSWVKTNIRYVEDPLGVQWIREPARLWADREGDCKSFTLFIVSVLQNMQVPYIIRFVNTEQRGSKVVNHVYPVAILNGREIPMDAVHDNWNDEHPYYYAKDYNMTEISRLAGIGNAASQQEEIERYHADIKALLAELPPDEGPDITAMTEGQFRRFMSSEYLTAQADAAGDVASKTRYQAAAMAMREGRIEGIGNLHSSDAANIDKFLIDAMKATNPAFRAPVLEVPSGVSGSIGNIFKDLAEDIRDAWRSVINWLFKTALPKAAPFFSYTFMQSAPGAKSDKKRKRQLALLQWIEKTGKFETADAVKAAVRTGIVKKFGKTPEQLILMAKEGKKIAGFNDDDARVGAVVAFIVEAVMFVIDIIKKIGKLFKQSSPDTSNADAPDFDELSQEFAITRAPATPPAGSGPGAPIPGPQSAGKQEIPQWLIPAAAGVALLFVLKK